MKLVRSLFATSLVLGLLAAAPAARALPNVWLYPSSAPCDTTLQACVNAAAAGDTVRVVADVPQAGSLSLTKSLTIEGDPNVTARPALGRKLTRTAITISSEDPTDVTQVNVTIHHLRLVQMGISAYYPKGSGSTLEISDVDISSVAGSNGNSAIDLTAYAPITVRITDDTIESDGYGIRLSTATGGTAGFGVPTPGAFEAWIERNDITTPDPSNSVGNDLSLRPYAGSSSWVRFYDNLIDGVGGCNCGNASGVAIGNVSVSGSGGDSRVDAWHNTIVRTGKGGTGFPPGIAVGRDPLAPLMVTLFDNIWALGKGGGIRVDGSPTMSNGLNDWYGNAEKNHWGVVPHPNELTVAPGFVDPGGDFRLASGSALFDRGAVCRPGGLGVLDLTGRLRLAGASVDVGAYERGAAFGTSGIVEIAGSADNTLTGTSGQDFLCGGPGKDDISGAGGSDYLEGGKGLDVVHGGPGDDTIVTKDGLAGDIADGGKGVDLCRVDPGDTKISC